MSGAALVRVLPAATPTDRVWRAAIVGALKAGLRHFPECFERGRDQTHRATVTRRQLSAFPCPWCEAVLDAVEETC